MALMYDMETVNRAMAEAMAFCSGPGVKLTSRERFILNTFAAMKPVEVELVKHACWIPFYTGYRCSACLRFTKKGRDARCKCGAIMDGEGVPENGKA